jgi:hypothetical protein
LALSATPMTAPLLTLQMRSSPPLDPAKSRSGRHSFDLFYRRQIVTYKINLFTRFSLDALDFRAFRSSIHYLNHQINKSIDLID